MIKQLVDAEFKDILDLRIYGWRTLRVKKGSKARLHNRQRLRPFQQTAQPKDVTQLLMCAFLSSPSRFDLAHPSSKGPRRALLFEELGRRSEILSSSLSIPRVQTSRFKQTP